MKKFGTILCIIGFLILICSFGYSIYVLYGWIGVIVYATIFGWVGLIIYALILVLFWQFIKRL